MKTISSIAEAKSLLAQNKDMMIRKDSNLDCWMQMGVRNPNNNLVANGEKVAQLSEEVFDALIPELDQVFCSEYFQPA